MTGKHGQDDRVSLLARCVTGSGLMGVLSGAVAWIVIRAQIKDEHIVVPGGDRMMAGRSVTGPLTAYAQAEAIKEIALGATGGKTYGELDEGDPLAETALHASLLRASLFTSVLAFGLAAAQVALGAVLVAVGTALSRLARRTPR
jgi:hypothetical protein